jgi:hypothetical protein
MASKSDRHEFTARIETVIELRLAGAEVREVLEYANLNEWSIGLRQCQKYCRLADERLAEQADKDRSRLLALHTNRRLALYRKAVADGDTRAALAVLRDLGQLQNVYPPKQVKLEDATTPQPPLSAEEVEALKLKLAARLTGPPAANGSIPEPAKP